MSDVKKRVIQFSPPDISQREIDEVIKALRSGWITTGPRTKLLERRLAAYIETGRVDIDCNEPANQARYANRVVCLNSATAAEEMNLRLLGVGPGDEVIVPAYTYTATASAAIHCGAAVRFVDIQHDGDPSTHMPEMDYDALDRAISEKTKAIVAVDLGGIVCDWERLMAISRAHRDQYRPSDSDSTPLGDLSSRIQKALGRVPLVADCAHSLGASRMIDGAWVRCGQMADFTSFSFHAVKNFTTAEGGASTWRALDGIDNEEIYHMFQLLSLHGQSKDALAKEMGSWEYDIVGPWYKCNMTDVTAAIGLGQLDRYPDLISRRAQIIRRYDAACDAAGVARLNHVTPVMDSSKHLYLVRIPGASEQDRNRIIDQMAAANVACNVHYKPLPMMTAYGADAALYPNSCAYYRNLISLPLHTLLTDEDVNYVCDTFQKAVASWRG